MLPPELVPERIRDAVGRRYQYDNSTFKVNWALREPIPWSAVDARRASTVHVAEGMNGLTRATTQLAASEIPDRPFLVLGQYSMVDPSRSPEGTETAWAYTHVPQSPRADAAGELSGDWNREEEGERFANRMEAEVERLAPGFRQRILKRHIQTPPTSSATIATWSAARSTAAPPSSTSRRSSGPSPASAGRRRRSAASTSPPPRPIPAAAFTAAPAATRRGPRCGPSG